MTLWKPPPDSSWGTSEIFVCFNDDCPYYVRGWEWMREHYDVVASYRFRYDPATGTSGPLAVRSPSALKESIIENRNSN